MAVLDTERGSASLYADDFKFDVLELEDFSPEKYIEGIKAAESAGYDVLVIDSLSHAWMGKGGALDIAEAAGKRAGGNTFAGWRTATPAHNKLIDAILGCKMHVITTMRSRTEWVIAEDDRGKKVPKKVGMAPVQKNDAEYEFSLFAEMNHDHEFNVTKSRCSVLQDKVFVKPGKDVADILVGWLNSGVAEKEITQAPVADPMPNTVASTIDTPQPAGADDSRPLTDDEVFADFSAKIVATTDLTALNRLIPALKLLSTDMQKKLGSVYTGHKTKLSS